MYSRSQAPVVFEFTLQALLIVFNRGGILCRAQDFLWEFCAPMLNFSYQLKILTIKKRCFGVWPKHGHFTFFKEDYHV